MLFVQLSVLLLATLLFQVTVTTVYGQDDFDKAVEEVFPSPPASTEVPQQNIGGCTCVPYYLCNNQTINTDGTGLIDIRFVYNY